MHTCLSATCMRVHDHRIQNVMYVQCLYMCTKKTSWSVHIVASGRKEILGKKIFGTLHSIQIKITTLGYVGKIHVRVQNCQRCR